MIEGENRSQRRKVAIPIRVQGMDHRSKFFDESTETWLVSGPLLITSLANLVDLETELHVINRQNQIGGTFRVLWVNTRPKERRFATGLELVQAEQELWPRLAVTAGEGEPELAPWAFLECGRCHERILTPVRETEEEFLSEGFVTGRVCDRCKATTAWQFSTAADALEVEVRASVDQTGEAQWSLRKKRAKDLRRKGRAPLKMQIKVIRKSYGHDLEDICKTVNVSRHGVCFLSTNNYEVGESLRVVVPYEEGAMSIPVPAEVVRVEEAKGSMFQTVAIELEPPRK
jgi:hypothetical protein